MGESTTTCTVGPYPDAMTVEQLKSVLSGVPKHPIEAIMEDRGYNPRFDFAVFPESLRGAISGPRHRAIRFSPFVADDSMVLVRATIIDTVVS